MFTQIWHKSVKIPLNTITVIKLRYLSRILMRIWEKNPKSHFSFRNAPFCFIPDVIWFLNQVLRIFYFFCSKEVLPKSNLQTSASEFHQSSLEIKLESCVIIRWDQNQTWKSACLLKTKHSNTVWWSKGGEFLSILMFFFFSFSILEAVPYIWWKIKHVEYNSDNFNHKVKVKPHTPTLINISKVTLSTVEV